MTDDPKETFVELCSKFDSAMLVTQSLDGALTARPMMIAQLDNDGDMWFATDHNSGKVDDILQHPDVKDRRHVHELWSEPWRVWFPDGPDDPSIALIRVHASAGEFWSNSGTNRAKYLFEAAKAYMSGSRPQADDPNQHARVKLD